MRGLVAYRTDSGKKFSIAFALATNCPLLLMDEPTNGIRTYPAKRQFRRMVAAMPPERTLMMATHQIADVENLVDRVVILDQGRIVLDQTMDQIANRYQFETNRLVPADSALYQEELGGSFQTLAPNDSSTPSRVDITLLFNAVMTQPERFTSLLHHEPAL